MEARREGNCSGRFQSVPPRNAVLTGRLARRGEAVSAYVFPEKELVGRLENDGTTVQTRTVRWVRWYDERKKSEKSRGRTSITLEKRKTRTDQEEKETPRVV